MVMVGGEMIVSWICSRSIIRKEVVPKATRSCEESCMLFGDQFPVDENAVAAAQIFDKDVVFVIDDQTRMLPGDA